MHRAEFSISVHDLDAAGKPFRFVVPAAWIRGTLEATDVASGGNDGELAGRLSKSGKDVVLRARLRAQLCVPCARCLQPARVSIDEEIGALAIATAAQPETRPAPGRKSGTSPALPRRGRNKPDEEEEPGADEADILPFDGDSLVLDDLVRDELLLGIPMIPLCSEACPGIRPSPADSPRQGVVDPRLSPLIKYKKL
jgi:DUF177 domain-containing protein